MKKGFFSKMLETYKQFNEEESIAELADYTTEEGLLIRSEDLNSGTAIMRVDEEGNEFPLEAGEYVIVVDDVTITVIVEEDGVIATVNSDEVEDETEEVEVEEQLETEERKENFEGEVGAFIELPVGVWLIDGKEYTVVEVTEGDMAYNSIESIIPVSEVSEEVEMEEETENKEEEVKEDEKEEFSKSDILAMFNSLKEQYDALEEKMSKTASKDTLDTEVKFSEEEVTVNRGYLGSLRKYK